MNKRLRVAVLYGGRSGEHEISLQSAASVLRNLDPERFEAIPIGIDKQGRWRLNDISLIEKGARVLPIFKDAPTVMLPPNPPPSSGVALMRADSQAPAPATPLPSPLPSIDVVFPVMHGSFCEDGTIQGLLELTEVPYVGCGVLASAVGMDKDVAKRLARDAGLPIVPWLSLTEASFKQAPADIAAKVEKELGYPCFVKPSSSGSSVGVHKVKAKAELFAAITDAFRYDRKVLIERGVAAREIEVAVLENVDEAGAPLSSIAGEIRPTAQHEFYSYAAKYLDEKGAELLIPADLSKKDMATVQKLAAAAFLTLGCEGMARVDFFLDRNDGAFYFNEVNTIPGFTSISMYPKLWEASGISYRELLSRLIDLALRRAEKKRALVRDYLSQPSS